MSDEVSLSKGWSLDAYVSHNESMREETDRRYEQRFAAQQAVVEAALTSAKEAVMKAERASEKRFESVNEFRQTLSDQAAKFASAEKVNDLASRIDRWEGRAGGQSATWAYIIAGIGLVGTIVGIIAAVTLLQRG